MKIMNQSATSKKQYCSNQVTKNFPK